jgi:acyl carrier protein
MTVQAELEAWITDWLARELRISPGQVGLDQTFTSYGLDSVYATMLVGDLEDHLSRRLSPTLAWNHSSVKKLAEYLSQLPAETAVQTDVDLLTRLDELPEEEIDRLLKAATGEA